MEGRGEEGRQGRGEGERAVGGRGVQSKKIIILRPALLAICSAFSIKSLLFGNARVLNESASAAKWMNAAKFSVVTYRVFTDNLSTFMQADHHSGNQPIVNIDYSHMCKVINSISDSSHYFA